MDLQAVARDIDEALRAGKIRTKQDLQKVKHRAVREAGLQAIPTDPDLVSYLAPEHRERFGHLFRKKPMRSESGVAIVAVMSSPAGCPHGKCIYCPGGPDVDAPQSYTGFEPSTMRAKRHGYDSHAIVTDRLAQLEKNGHSVEKLEIIIQGGTFPAREEAYQDWFVHGIFAACNEQASETEEAWIAMDSGERDRRLAAVQADNESAPARIIGLTIETKPDWCLEPHVDGMLRRGATRVELGIQTLSEEVTKLTNRGHTIQDARDAMRVTRDAGLKSCVHMMPGLPRPSDDGYAVDEAADIEDLKQLFEDPDFRPDMLKIYPTLVVKEGETTLKTWWKTGKFVPMDTASATRVVAEGKRYVPEYCRIQRIDRDIPTTHVLAGVMNSNLRQLAQARMAEAGHSCRCIRCREVSIRIRDGTEVQPNRLELVERRFEASNSDEVFLSYEDPEADALVAFLRLRRLGESHRSELAAGDAMIRELKVYGVAQHLGEHDDPETGAWQHHGLGAKLMRRAEAIAHEWGSQRIAVIAGAGVKPYYRKHGYSDAGPYLAKPTPTLQT